MVEILQNREFIFWAAIVLLVAIPSVAHYWWKIRKIEIDAALKHDMLQRGMSAAEIQTVLNTSRRGKCDE